MTNAKEAAKQIRADLKKFFGKGTAYEGTKFSVRSSSGYVSIEYIDGPRPQEVKEIVSKYERVQRCEYSGDILSGGNLFVSVSHRFSPEVEQRLESALCSYYADWQEIKNTAAGNHWRKEFLAKEWNWEEHEPKKQEAVTADQPEEAPKALTKEQPEAAKVETIEEIKNNAVLALIEEIGPCPEEVDDSIYQERVEAKRARYESLSAKASSESDRHWQRSRELVEHIPFGQPIIVGHHSEKGDRRRREKSWDALGRSVEASKKSKYYEEKADSVGTGGISSDSANADRELWLKLAELVKHQAVMVATNKIVKSKAKKWGQGNDRKIQALQAMGWDEIEAIKLFTPDFCGRIGFPDYATQNNNANIRRIKQRIQSLKKLSQMEDREYAIANGFTSVVHDTADNRVYLSNASKPSEEIRAIYKKWGFRWSRRNQAWSRQLNQSSIRAVKCVETDILSHLSA